MSTKYPQSVNELPKKLYYAILTGNSTYVEGDERSRTNPGHGYPAHTVHNWDMQVFATKEEWEKEIIKLSSQTGYYRKEFQAIKVEPAQITTKIEIS